MGNAKGSDSMLISMPCALCQSCIEQTQYHWRQGRSSGGIGSPESETGGQQ